MFPVQCLSATRQREAVFGFSVLAGLGLLCQVLDRKFALFLSTQPLLADGMRECAAALPKWL